MKYGIQERYTCVISYGHLHWHVASTKTMMQSSSPGNLTQAIALSIGLLVLAAKFQQICSRWWIHQDRIEPISCLHVIAGDAAYLWLLVYVSVSLQIHTQKQNEATHGIDQPWISKVCPWVAQQVTRLPLRIRSYILPWCLYLWKYEALLSRSARFDEAHSNNIDSYIFITWRW